MKVLSQLRSKDQNWISLRNFKINIFNSTAGINFVTNKTILKKLSQPLPNIVCDQRWSEQMNPTMTGYIIDLEDIKIYKKCVQLPTSMETDEPEYICNRIFSPAFIDKTFPTIFYINIIYIKTSKLTVKKLCCFY